MGWMNKRKMAGQVRAGWSEWIRGRRKNIDEETGWIIEKNNEAEQNK